MISMVLRLTTRTGWIATTLLFGLCAASGVASGQVLVDGAEYKILPSLPGSQVQPSASWGSNGGYVVVQDEFADGDGLGLRARRFHSDFSASPSTFVVNSLTAGDQQNAKVAATPDGGAVFVWEGGPSHSPKVYIRFLGENGVFANPEFRVSAGDHSEATPSVAVLSDGSVLAVWSSYGADGDMWGVFARRFSANGTALSDVFAANQRVSKNQRDPSVVALTGGKFLIAWTSDQQRSANSVDIVTRAFNQDAQPLGDEQVVNTSSRLCSSPVLAASPSGFVVGWYSSPTGRTETTWDVFARAYGHDLQAASGETMINTHQRLEQTGISIASIGDQYLAVWTSFVQDGDRLGVYSQAFQFPLQKVGVETRVNTTTNGDQLAPTVASNGSDRFVVAWSSFVGGIEQMDLMAQRYRASGSAVLEAPSAPFLSAVDQKSLFASWPEVLGVDLSHYLVFVDGSTTGVRADQNFLVVGNSTWNPSSAHSVRTAYVLNDGRMSPLSTPATASTWSVDANGDGIPDEWQTSNWGKPANWPSALADSDGDGASNYQEFLAGTDPTSAESVLRSELYSNGGRLFLKWNTQPTFVYQIQVSEDLKSWSAVGQPRLAVSSNDVIAINSPGSIRYYRVLRLR